LQVHHVLGADERQEPYGLKTRTARRWRTAPLGDFCRPVGPSSCSFLSRGETRAINWKMIDAEMYGMIPSPKIVDW